VNTSGRAIVLAMAATSDDEYEFEERSSDSEWIQEDIDDSMVGLGNEVLDGDIGNEGHGHDGDIGNEVLDGDIGAPDWVLRGDPSEGMARAFRQDFEIQARGDAWGCARSQNAPSTLVVMAVSDKACGFCSRTNTRPSWTFDMKFYGEDHAHTLASAMISKLNHLLGIAMFRWPQQFTRHDFETWQPSQDFSNLFSTSSALRARNRAILIIAFEPQPPVTNPYPRHP